MRRIAFSLPAILFFACGSSSDRTIAIAAVPSLAAPLKAFAAEVPWDSIEVVASADPMNAAPSGALRIAAIADLQGCADCFRIDDESGIFVIHGDGALGVQYGLSALLEAAGFRFHRPLAPSAPGALAIPSPDSPWLGKMNAAEKRLRGVHLHTIHPIEAYFSHWADGPLDDARRIHQWIVANRGNYVEWVALADIESSAARAADWRARTRLLVDDAHARGLRAGIGVELFHASDLQHAFDLIDADPMTLGDPTSAIDARLALFADLGFDIVDVSFGEFSAIDPATFIRALNIAAAEIHKKLGAEVTATIHVGGLPSQQVTYQGKTLPYYFLVQFADPSITPWIHTVMYYDLYEDAGGAYDLASFASQRQYLLDRLAAGQSVAYYPETAYWVAFDDSVPLYVPLYVRSRFTDIAGIRADAKAGSFNDLDGQVQFSSGFEWGYWQQDRIALRMAYQLPAQWEDAFSDLFPASLAADVVALTNAQHDALIGRRLAPYLAGRDLYIDTGSRLGIHSQPDRPSFASVAAMAPQALVDFTDNVLAPLGQLADQLETIAISANGHADSTDPEQAEVADGAAIDAKRARFIYSCYSVAAAKAAGGATEQTLATAKRALADAGAIVARRHAGIPANYRADGIDNATIYPFGYLAQADVLCYWQREWIQVQNLVEGANAIVPSCVF